MFVAEQVRQCHRQLGGDRAAEEADSVVGRADRAHVVLGLLVGFGSGECEDWQQPAVDDIRALRVRCRIVQFAVIDVKPAQALNATGASAGAEINARNRDAPAA